MTGVESRYFLRINGHPLHQTAMLYAAQEKARAKVLADQLKTFEGVLVWGAGDNFHRSSENEGPLSRLPNIVVLDQRPQVLVIGDRRWITETPTEGIRRRPWPVLITVSVARDAICQQVKEIDPSRQVFFL
jgi:hypothetical protein